MLARLTEAALRQRLLALIAAALLAVWGWQSYRGLPIDAFPDVAPTQVLVSVRAPGLTPEELEARVTVPIELTMKGIPNLVRMRSTTRFSVTLLTFEFAEGTDIYWARAQVNERLQGVLDDLPSAATGGLAPIVTPLAEMLMFTLERTGEGATPLSPEEARSLTDWVVRPALRAVPGVADINVLGGFVRTYEVVPSPAAMAARGITTAMLRDALEANNRNEGAGRLPDGEEALLVRAEGRIRSLEDVRSIVVSNVPGDGSSARPGGVVRVADIADVRFGALPRNGVVTRDGEGEAVWGLVLGLRGVDARQVVEGVKARLPEVERLLPDGVRISLFYDRADLIGKAVWTVQKVLLEAIALVVVLLLLFLGNWRAAIVVSAILPLAVLATFGIMKAYGLSANIMSLGGLAIAIGLLVDCAVVVVENVVHRIQHAGGRVTLEERVRMTLEATKEVAPTLVSGVIIIVTVFVPLLSLQGLEGRLFSPVALTIAFALGAALLLSLTVVPTLCALLLRGPKPGKEVREPWLVRKLHAAYDPFLEWAMRNPFKVAGTAGAGLVAAGLAFTQIGSTFMPTMDEGTPVVTVRKHPTINVDDAAATDLRIQRLIMERVPEVRGVMARAGADELGLDPVGLNETDMFFTLAPREAWRNPAGGTPWLLNEIRGVLDEVPGLSFSFAQPIDMRVQEMIIGARGDVVVRVFGPEIGELNRLAREIAEAIRGVSGSSDVFALRNEGMKYLTIRVDRLAAARLGINASDVQASLRVFVDGMQVGTVLEPGNRRITLTVRGEEAARRSAADLARVPIALPGGGTVLLSQVADIREEDGPVQVIREDARRFATVLSNVTGGRDLVGFVDEAQARVRERVQLPRGYDLDWGGQFENQQRSAARLSVVVPIALAAIFLLLHMTFGSVRQAVLVFCNVPFAAIGGVIALWASGEFISVPASVGFLCLIGIAVLNGVVMVGYVNSLVADRGLSAREAAVEGAKRRMTPVTLTATIAAIALVPFLFATGPGAEIQRPLAIVVIGGLVTATILTLVLLPILYARFGQPTPRATEAEESGSEAAPGPVTAGGTAAGVGALLALLAFASPAVAQTTTGQTTTGQARTGEVRTAQTAPQPGAGSSVLSSHLERALGLDPVTQSLAGARRAAEARGVIARSPVAGPPAILGGGRTDIRGPDRAREFDLEVAAPIWLRGQRDAIRGTVATSVEEVDRRVLQRRLEVAAILRDAWWDTELARRDLAVARDRLATARDIARDIRRRTELGDLSGQEALLGESETLAAQSELARAEAALAAARAAYAVLTGGAEPPPGTPERPARAGAHPAIRAAEAGLAAAQARRQLVLATPRDNPEVGVFGRHDAGVLVTESTTVGVRFRVPLATEQRNAPRRAEAEAEVTRAEAELAAQRRLRDAEATAAEASLAAAERFAGIARERARVAAQQSDGARRAFSQGEIGAFDLFRVRQLTLEAQGARARAEADLGRARSRLNQALGAEP